MKSLLRSLSTPAACSTSCRLLIALLALCLVPSVAFADAGACAKRTLAALDGVSPDEVELTTAVTEPLFVEADGLAVGDTLRVEVLIDGVTTFQEDLELVETAAPGDALLADAPAEVKAAAQAAALLEGRPVVELLAAHGQRLERLEHLAQTRSVDLAVHRDGAVDRRPLSDLRAASDALSAEPFAPFALVSSSPAAVTIEAPTKLGETVLDTVQTKSQCEQYCDDQYDDCIWSRCEPQGSSSCYDACYDQFLDCLEWECSICEVSSTTSTQNTLHSQTPTPYVECRYSPIFGYGKGQYRYIERVIKQTRTTTTTNSDCSETVTTSVSYFNSNCWTFLYPDNFCFSLGTIYNIC